MSVIITLLPALGWGLMPLVLKKVDGNINNDLIGTGIGALITGILVYIFSNTKLDLQTITIGILSGSFWVLGQLGQYKCYRTLGVSKTIPISTGFQIIGTSLIGIIFFNEWSKNTSKIIGLFPILFIILGVFLTSYSENKEKSKLGPDVLLLGITSTGYWVYSAIPKLSQNDGVSLFVPQMLGVFLATMIFSFFNDSRAFKESKSYKSLFVGILFGLAALAYIYSAKINGVATAYIIAQLNVVVSTLSAIFVLKENKSRKEKVYSIVGLCVIVMSSIVTSLL